MRREKKGKNQGEKARQMEAHQRKNKDAGRRQANQHGKMRIAQSDQAVAAYSAASSTAPSGVLDQLEGGNRSGTIPVCGHSVPKHSRGPDSIQRRRTARGRLWQ